MSDHLEPQNQETLNSEAENTLQSDARKPKIVERLKTGGWYATLVFLLYLSLPQRAQAQFGDIFSKIFNTIQSDMGSSLKTINQITKDTQQLYQEAVWPLAMVNQARGFVSSSINTYRNSMNQIFRISSPSATLPVPQQFESLLHSRSSAQISALQTSFTSNYGTVPQVNAAAPQDRVMVDIDDALSQENLKTSLVADQGQDLLIQTADQMENQVAVSAPGSTPFITAQAQVANLRCQAYMQKMLAAELRQEAGRIAHDNVLVKRRASAAGNINQIVSGSLTHQ